MTPTLKKRLFILGTITVVILATCLSAIWQLENRIERTRQDKTTRQLSEKIDRILTAQYAKKADSLAQAEPVIQLLCGKQPDTERDVSLTLNTTRLISGADLVYLLDRNGTLIAASKHHKRAEFIGKPHEFRLYFQAGMQGKSMIYPSVGATTRERGVYFSAPVLDPVKRSPIGVAVIKAGMGEIDALLMAQQETVALLSADGIIFATNKPAWLYQSRQALTKGIIERIHQERQFPREFPLKTLPVSISSGIKEVILDNINYSVSEASSKLPGWKIITLERDERPYALFGFSTTIILLLSSLIALYLISLDKKQHLQRRYDIQSDDLTRTRNELLRNESLLNAVVNDQSELISRFNAENVITFVNSALCRYYGRSSEELLGSSLLPNFVEEDLDALTKQFQSLTPEKPVAEVEYRIDLAGQGIRWHHTTIRKIFDDQGQLTEYQTVTKDITERKQAEDALYDSRQMLQLVLDTIPQRVFWKNKDLVYVGCNKTLAQDCGCKEPVELIGKTDYDLGWSDTAERYTDDDRQVMQTGIPKLNYEEPQHGSDGSLKWLEKSKVPLRDKSGNIIGILGTYEDITERKNMESELLRAQKLESIGLLAGGIAHDFNNVLTAILGYISLAKRSAAPDTKQFNHLIEAEQASFRARDLTQRLITFARGGSPVRKTLQLAELIRNAAGLTLSGSMANCDFIIPEDLWSVNADEGQINQVINIFVSNADQAMPGGGKIAIHCENIEINQVDTLPLGEGKYITIAIQDQGSGIAEENINKIFDPYFTTKDKGRGLGLTAAYSIIKRHGGHISVKSSAGNGTTFTIYLPATTPEAQNTMTVITLPKQNSVNGRILVMDDEEIVRMVAGEMLEYLGCTVDFAENGEEAVEKYKLALQAGIPFDAVIMDLTIPGAMGGKDAIKLLRDIDPQVKAIVSSGYSSDPIMADYESYGFAGVVSKPYQLPELNTQLGRILALI